MIRRFRLIFKLWTAATSARTAESRARRKKVPQVIYLRKVEQIQLAASADHSRQQCARKRLSVD